MTPKITVCDDETKIIEDIKRIIEKEIPDAEISAYTNGDSLLKGLEEDNYDIVLLDIDMPGIKNPHYRIWSGNGEHIT